MALNAGIDASFDNVWQKEGRVEKQRKLSTEAYVSNYEISCSILKVRYNDDGAKISKHLNAN
jgi:hypothetical protein